MQYCAVLCNDAGCGYNSSDSQDDAGPWPRVRQNAVDVALGVDADEPSWGDARAQAGRLSDATHFVERRFLPRPVGADAKGGDVSFFADLGILAQQRWQVGAAQPQPQRVFPASSALEANLQAGCIGRSHGCCHATDAQIVQRGRAPLHPAASTTSSTSETSGSRG